MKPTRILIADDHEVIRQGLAGLIAAEGPGWDVCGTAADGHEAVVKAIELRPDIVIMDYKMPALDGNEATKLIKMRLPETEVLLFTGTTIRGDLLAVYRSEAKGALLKSEAAEELIPALEALRRHHRFRSKQVEAQYERIIAQHADPLVKPLTPRELETLRAIAEGKSSKEIAVQMGVSVKTIETHRTRLFRKIEARSAAEAVRYAVREGLIEP